MASAQAVERSALTTVNLWTPITQMIFFNQGINIIIINIIIVIITLSCIMFKVTIMIVIIIILIIIIMLMIKIMTKIIKFLQ